MYFLLHKQMLAFQSTFKENNTQKKTESSLQSTYMYFGSLLGILFDIHSVAVAVVF